MSGLPQHWVRALPRLGDIEDLCERLHARISAQSTKGPQVEPRTSETHPIHVDWLPTSLKGRIGITFAPGQSADSAFGPPWRRDLGVDLDVLVNEFGASLLISLMEEDELGRLGIPHLVPEAARRGLEVHRHAIPDGGTPELHGTRYTIGRIIIEAASGRDVIIHCRAGRGRSGTVAACVLIALGHDPSQAIRRVRTVRAGAIENGRQEQFVSNYEHEP
jgi:hypothetical protein